MMRPARLAGALALGLPAAVLAHMAVFGNDHAAAGAYHAWLIDAVGLSVAFFILGFAFHAAVSASAIRNGSIVAARLYRFFPSLVPVAVSALCWYGGVERLESHGPALPFLTIVALAISAFAVHAFARAAIRAVSHAVVFALGALPMLEPIDHVFVIAAPPIRVKHATIFARLYSRPPPFLP